MEFIVPLPQLLKKNGVLIKQWSEFSERFNAHCNSASLQIGNSLKPSLLLFAGHHQVKNIIECLKVFTDLDLVELGKVLEVIERTCLPLVFLLFERFRYFTSTQEAGDICHNFSMTKQQIELCELDEVNMDSMSELCSSELKELAQPVLGLCDTLASETSLKVGDEYGQKSFTASSAVRATPSLSGENMKLAITDDALSAREKQIPETSENRVDTLNEVTKRNICLTKFDSYTVEGNLMDSGEYAKQDFDNPHEQVLTYNYPVKQKCIHKRSNRLKRGFQQNSGLWSQSSLKTAVFLCFQCNNEYTTRKSFCRHVRTKHTGCDPFYCKHCQVTFQDRMECILHCKGHGNANVPDQTITTNSDESREYLSALEQPIPGTSESHQINSLDEVTKTNMYLMKAVTYLIDNNLINNGEHTEQEINVNEHDMTYKYPLEEKYLDIGGNRLKSKFKKVSGVWSHSALTTPMFLCFQCDNEYTTRKSFCRHIRTKHSGCLPFFCKHCQVAFQGRFECILHCKGHGKLKVPGLNIKPKSEDIAEYQCWFCDARILDLSEYKKHCLSHSAVRVYHCDMCQRKNHTIIRMIGHLKGHLNPRFRCEICANCFGRAELLEAHMQTHESQPYHQCPICFKSYISRDRLQGHMKTHSGEKPFVCELCGRSFCQMVSLEYHKRVHSGDKPYQCHVCGKKTACFSYLRKHQLVHTDKRPYICEICGKSFRFISSLRRHNRGHSGQRAYECKACGRTFIYDEGLRDHIKANRCPGRKDVTKRFRRSRRFKGQKQAAPSSFSFMNEVQGLVLSQRATEGLLSE